jgi:hypothetical protein
VRVFPFFQDGDRTYSFSGEIVTQVFDPLVSDSFNFHGGDKICLSEFSGDAFDGNALL